MNKILSVESLAQCMAYNRTKVGKSQKYMAKAMNKSVGTIQNWESGYSTPNIIDLVDWFDILGLNPLRSVMEFIHPEIYRGINPSDTTNKIREGLDVWVNNIATDDEIRKLSYFIYGNTGSSWHSQINEVCALNHLPIADRIVIAEIILSLYQLKESQRALINTNHIAPDIDNFKEAINKCKQSVLEGKNEYSMT